MFDTVGDADEIQTVAARIAGMDEANKARRAAILDECWEEVLIEDEAD